MGNWGRNEYGVAWWDLGFQWFKLRHRAACFRRDLPWKIALMLPRSVALCAFIRVYGVLGECGPEFATITDLWGGQR